jgi:PKD repeat protein
MRRPLTLLAILAICVGLVGLPARAPGELHVPQDYATIQEAIEAAKPGDTILVDPGTYVENPKVDKRELAIRGTDPDASKVIIQAKFSDEPVVLVRERDVRLSNLTLTGGLRGLKIESRADRPALVNLIIRANEDEGLFVEGARGGELRDSLITKNRKGIFLGSGAEFRLQGNRIQGNQAGLEAFDVNRLELRENFIIRNSGCGLKADESSADPHVLVGENNVIFGNGQDLCGAAQGREDLLDRTPPPAPDLTVSPPDWTNQGRFTVDWENPEDIAGIAAYWFKLGAAPTTPDDGTRREIAEKPLIVENPPEGEQPVFVWLEDGMGNKTHENAARRTIKFDKTPPLGTLLINDGATRTTELVVTLGLQAQDNASGIVEMRFSNDGQTWSEWEPFAETKRDWDLSEYGGSADPGPKTVYAELRDRAGNVGRLQAEIEYIRAEPPTASFTVTPENPRPGQVVTFDASGSTSPNGRITNYKWDFGDGTQEETDRPIIQHTYREEGRYTVRLVVTDVLGLTASAEREVPVEMRPATLRVPQDFFTIEEALAAAQPGDIILLSPGFYSFNLVLDKSITLKGTDPGVTLQGRDKAKPVLTIQGEVVRVQLETLTLATLAGATAPTIAVQGEAELSVTDVTVGNSGSGAGLQLAGSARLALTNARVTSEGGTALQAQDRAQATVQGSTLSGRSGVGWGSAAPLEITGSTITATGGDGLTFSGSGEASLTLTDVQLSAGGNGLIVEGASRLVLTDSTVTATGGDGLAFNSPGALTLEDVRLTATGAGLSIEQAAQVTLSNIEIEAGGDGLSCSGSGSLELTDMKITAGKAAVRLSGSVQAGFDLADSTLSGDEAGIVLKDTAELTARGGTIRGGIGVNVSDRAELTLEEATVTGGVLDLQVIEQARARVLRTTLTGGLAGVMAGDAARLLLQSNEITDHAFWGVFLPTPACRPEPWPLRTLEGHTSSVFSVAFSPDGKLLASGSWDDTVKLWEVSTGQEVRTLEGHTNSVWSVAFSPDGKLLASGSLDDTVKLWDAATGRELRTLEGHTDDVESVAFSPDGKLLASGSDDDTIKLWDVATGSVVRTLRGHTGDVESVAFSPDGKLLASGSGDDTIKLWDAATGQELRTLEGHTAWVLSVAFSPDGQILASGSDDDTIKLWDAATGRLVRTLEGHTAWVLSVAFSPDGELLASGSGDKTIKLWEVAMELSVGALAEFSGPAREFSGTVVGGENAMARNGEWLPPELREATGGQGNVCPAELLFLVKQEE